MEFDITFVGCGFFSLIGSSNLKVSEKESLEVLISQRKGGKSKLKAIYNITNDP